MKVQVKIDALGNGQCIVTREDGDPKFYGEKNAAGESRFLYHLKAELKKQGIDCIKKRMWKDGHMVDQMQQYLRERNPKKKRCLAFWNGSFAITGLETDFNDGQVTLQVNNLSEL